MQEVNQSSVGIGDGDNDNSSSDLMPRRRSLLRNVGNKGGKGLFRSSRAESWVKRGKSVRVGAKSTIHQDLPKYGYAAEEDYFEVEESVTMEEEDGDNPATGSSKLSVSSRRGGTNRRSLLGRSASSDCVDLFLTKQSRRRRQGRNSLVSRRNLMLTMYNNNNNIGGDDALEKRQSVITSISSNLNCSRTHARRASRRKSRYGSTRSIDTSGSGDSGDETVSSRSVVSDSRLFLRSRRKPEESKQHHARVVLNQFLGNKSEEKGGGEKETAMIIAAKKNHNRMTGLVVGTSCILIIFKDVSGLLKLLPILMVIRLIMFVSLQLLKIIAKWIHFNRENRRLKRNIRTPLQRVHGWIYSLTRPWQNGNGGKFGAATGRLIAARLAYNKYQKLQTHGIRSRMQDLNQTFVREAEQRIKEYERR